MEQGNNSLKINIGNKESSYKRRPAVILPGVLILIGVWGLLSREWHIEKIGVNAPAGCIISVGVLVLCAFFERNRRKHRIILAAAVGALAAYTIIICVFSYPQIGAWAGRFREWIFLHTGYYTMPFENSGDGTLLLLPFAAGAGAMAALFQRVLPLLLQTAAALAVLLLLLFGMIGPCFFTGAVLAGSILAFAMNNRAGKRQVFMAAALAALLLLVISPLYDSENSASPAEKLSAALHDIKYERTQKVLPEGSLKNLPAKSRGGQETLKVSMSSWEPLYLKGFTSGSYTDEGWKPTDPEEILEEAQLLYNLQENYFFSAGQTAAAFEAVGEKSETKVTVENTGSCRAYPAVPYGVRIGAAEGLVPNRLTSEGFYESGISIDELTICPVSESYLLLEKIADPATEVKEAYKNAEAAYRSYVYEHYLDIPENIERVLKKYDLYGNKGVSTTQARAEITYMLGQFLTYDETAVTNQGSSDFLEYLLTKSRKGYDVHYATAAVMMMRSYGIPARYVEGYLASKDAAENLKDGQSLVLTSSDAHVWTEFYLDGIGWIPFDPTPGYTTQIKYELPAGEGEADETPSKLTKDYSRPAQEDVTVESSNKNEIKDDPDFQLPWFIILLICIIAFMAVMIIRAFILRAKLKKTVRRFGDPSPSVAAAALLVYSRRALECAGVTDGKQSIYESRQRLENEPDMEIGEADIRRAAELENEIWFSNHEITHEAKESAFKWKEAALNTWKRKIPVLKRWVQRFIQCRIL